MSTEIFLQRYAKEVSDTLGRLPWEQVTRAADMLHQARLSRVQVFICGNGGSAATASHFVNDLNKGANADGVPRFRAISLVDNVPLLMAWSNDACYEQGLSEPLRNLARPGDLLIGISCSGNSGNVLEAIAYAHEVGMQTLALTGKPGGKLASMADLTIVVPTPCVEQVEDVHMFLEHALVSALRDRAQRELIPSLILPDGRGLTPEADTTHATLRRPAILLDRDGVINANRPGHITRWEELTFLPGAMDALRKLAELNLPVVVITNQSAVGRNLVSFEIAESINLRLMQHVASHGGRIDAVAWCPHAPDEGCACRKPEKGLLVHASQCLGIDLERSYLVGDAATDVSVAMAAGAKPLLVLTGRGAEHRTVVEATWGQSCPVMNDLAQAAEWIADRVGTTSLRGIYV